MSELRLLFDPAEKGSFTVRLEDQPQHTVAVPATLTPFLSDDDYENLRRYLEAYMDLPDGGAVVRAQHVEAQFEQWGHRLHDAVFAPPENAALLRQLLAAPGPRELTIATDRSRLLRLPWELMADAAGSPGPAGCRAPPNRGTSVTFGARRPATRNMNSNHDSDCSEANTATPTRSATAMRTIAMIAWPVVIGGLAFFANAPFVQIVALPLLLLSWLGCMRLALTTSTKPPSRWTQLGASLLIALGLLSLVCFCAVAAHLAGQGRVSGDAGMWVDLAVYHIAALAVAGLVVWGQKLRGAVAGSNWLPWLLYWFAYCPVSVLVAKGVARVGVALGA